MKILVTGSNGFVGHKIMESLCNATASHSLRNMSESDIERMVDTCGADVIIHTAAVSDMRLCEADPESSYNANVTIPTLLAKACRSQKLICFSSDQVYNANQSEGPYSEEDAVPGNVYACQKFEMENRVLDILPSAVMLRAEWMYDYNETRSNYLMILLNATDHVSFSSRQFRGITYLKEAALNMKRAISLPGGAYNFGSETDKPMHEITADFLNYIGKDIRVEDPKTKGNLWMNCSKIRSFGIIFSSVSEGLKMCAYDYGLKREPHFINT